MAGKVVRGWKRRRNFQLSHRVPNSRPKSSTDLSNTNAGFWGGGHPNETCSGNLPSSQRTVQHWFDASCFPVADPNTFGDVHPGILDGPGYINLDFSALKDTKISERLNFQFRAELFNAFNKVNLDFPNTNVSSTLVGQILSARALQGVSNSLAG